MLRPIDKSYLIDLYFTSIHEDDVEYLKKDYVGVFIYSNSGELIDLVDITVYLEKFNNSWQVSRCISFDENKTNVFDQHFKTNSIKELLKFDALNSLQP